jgi:uncharacterized delta-60 repeat protein
MNVALIETLKKSVTPAPPALAAGFFVQPSPAGLTLAGLGSNSPFTYIVAHDLAIQPTDGKIVVSGYVANGFGIETPSDVATLFRYTANGSKLDTTFAAGAGYLYQTNSLNDQPYGGYGRIVALPSGRILTCLRTRSCGVRSIPYLSTDPLTAGATSITVTATVFGTGLATFLPPTPSNWYFNDGGDAGLGAIEFFQATSYGGGTNWTIVRGQLGSSPTPHTAVGANSGIPINVYMLNSYSVDAYTSAGVLDTTFNAANTTGMQGRAGFPMISWFGSSSSSSSSSSGSPVALGNSFDGTIAGMVSDFDIDASGNIVAVGWTQARCINTTQDAFFACIRYKPTGDIDTTFGSVAFGFGAASGGGGKAFRLTGVPGNGVDTATSVLVRASGKILIGGCSAIAPNTWNVPPNAGIGGVQPYFQAYAQRNNTSWALAQLTSTGALDTTFGTGGIVLVGNNNTAGLATIGSFWVGLASGSGAPCLPNNQGSFGAMAGKALAEDANGRIYATGYVSTNGVNGTWTVMRWSSTGTPDNTWGTNGVVTTTVGLNNLSFSSMLALDSASRLLVGGSVLVVSGANPNYGIAICRYNASVTGGTDNGTLDATFGTGGILTYYPAVGVYGAGITSVLNSFKLDASGNIVIVGTVGYTSAIGYITAIFLARFSPSGVLDNTFGQAALTTPAAPTGVVAATSGANILVKWSWNSGVGDVAYNVYYGATPGSETLLASNVTTNTYLSSAGAGYYQVTAVNSAGVEGPRSAETQSFTGSSPLLTNLVAYYAFDSLTIDSSGNGHTLTVNGNVTQAIGFINKGCIFLAGASPADYLSTAHPTVLDGATALTVDTFVRVNDTTITSGIVCVGDFLSTNLTFLFQYRGSDTGKFRINIPTSVSDTGTYAETVFSPVQGTPYYICIVFNGAGTGNAGRLAVYINGILQTLTFAGTIPAALPATGTAPLTLGSFVGGGNELTGTMDEVGIYNATATAASIAIRWNSGAGLSWPFVPQAGLLAPFQVTGSATSPTLTLVWPAVTNATSYIIYRSTTPGNEVQYDTSPSAGYVDAGVAANTTYYYKVAAVGGGVTGPQSAELKVPYLVVLLKDLMAGSNGVSITARPMNVGGNWTDLSGDFTTNGSGGCVPTTAGVCLAIGNATQPDMDVSATVNGSTSAFPGVAARVQDLNNYWLAVVTSTTTVAIFEVLAGVATQRGPNGAITFAGSTNETLELKVVGNVFQVYYNGAAVSGCTFTSADLNTATGAGIRNNVNATMTYSNFQVLTP